MEKKKMEIKPKIPKTVELRLRLVPDSPKPMPDGRWRFRVAVGANGMPDFSILARTSKSAKQALADYAYNELDGGNEIEADE